MTRGTLIQVALAILAVAAAFGAKSYLQGVQDKADRHFAERFKTASQPPAPTEEGVRQMLAPLEERQRAMQQNERLMGLEVKDLKHMLSARPK